MSVTTKSININMIAIYGPLACPLLYISFMSMEVKKIRILIVDDEKAIRDNLANLLSDMGFEIGIARNGEEGLYLFSRG